MKPDARLYRHDPAHLRELVKRTGLSQGQCADALGIDHRTMRRYLDTRGTFPAPYCVAFALHCLAVAREREAKSVRRIATKGLTA
jgi:predicted transcriptional regulator